MILIMLLFFGHTDSSQVWWQRVDRPDSVKFFTIIQNHESNLYKFFKRHPTPAEDEKTWVRAYLDEWPYSESPMPSESTIRHFHNATLEEEIYIPVRLRLERKLRLLY